MCKGRTWSIAAVLLATCACAQEAKSDVRFRLGIGAGQDFGGIGLRMDLVALERLALFGGLGYAFGLPGTNAGLQWEMAPQWKDCPFVCVMYGYNAVEVETSERWSFSPEEAAMYYGPTIGGGITVGRTAEGSHLKLGIYKPLRSGRAAELEARGDLLPVTFSIGYHFSL